LDQFVKAIEIWVPSGTKNDLELSSSFYGKLKLFRETSEKMSFSYAEGLPGKTWESGKPVVLKEFTNSDFQRTEIARQAGITCGISLPIYCGDFLLGVVVIFCGEGHGMAGAVEVWNNEGQHPNELKLVDGYYGELERFEWVSRRLTIMRGRGLPGSAWDKNLPVIINNLGESSTFLRATHAAEAGITTGFAIPFNAPDNSVNILTLLSAKGTPIARRFEIWKVDHEKNVLYFDSGHCSSGSDLKAKHKDNRIKKGEGPLGTSWLTGRPLVTETALADHQALVIFPVIQDCKLTAMGCMWL
jgi:hypothetical protein